MLLRRVCAALLEMVHPLDCLRCGNLSGTVAWAPSGSSLPGLRPWDAPPLCGACAADLTTPAPVAGLLPVDGGLWVQAAVPTHGSLVDLVGAWKYRGLRGAAWPLSTLLCAAWPAQGLREGFPGGFVPLPLHRSRRRSRGFNQAETLAAALAAHTGLAVHPCALRRARPTPQQAKVRGLEDRLTNVAGAFGAGRGSTDMPAGPVALVDDLVTSGATAAAAARALVDAGWTVGGVLAVGWAGPGWAQVDSPGSGF